VFWFFVGVNRSTVAADAATNVLAATATRFYAAGHHTARALNSNLELSMTAQASLALAGKIAVVTGGSNGIGAAAVRLLAAEGATVVIGFHTGLDRAEALRASLPASSLTGTGHSIQQITNESSASVSALVEMLKHRYGRCDILVNSGGTTQPIPHANLEQLTDELFDQILVTNVRGPFATIRALAPLMKSSAQTPTGSRETSVIVNVSSIAAFTAQGSNIAYCASKAALDTMTMSLARVLGPEIRVLGVSPGAVATGFVAGRGREQLQKMADATPLKAITEADDVARAIIAAITHFTSSTGTTFVVDGGRHL
jgi:3-oxoacyl-[acyl-carrier protein] reductase